MNNARHRPGPALVILALVGAIAADWPAPAAQPAQPFAFNLPAPKLAGKAEDWLNTEGKKLEFEKGRVYVVEFWTFGCINCQRNLPAYARWQKRFADQKLTIIGVHTPETAEEKKTENVIAHVKQLGITYPVLLDQAAVNWKKWQQQWWPTVYLVDKKGQVRYRWLGELNWQKATGDEDMAKCIEKLLAEGGAGTNSSVVVR
jgi:thiol-disulfide isomerase/thioredoxin